MMPAGQIRRIGIRLAWPGNCKIKLREGAKSLAATPKQED